MSVGNTANTTKKQKEKKDEDIDDVDIYMCVLFDGTNNNRDNISRYQDYKKNNHPIKAWILGKTHASALEDYSNVARYSHICRVDDSNKKKMYSFVYVDGIGTSTRFVDSMVPGKSFGTWVNGVNAKVEKGCKLICNEINRLSQKFTKKSRVKLHCSVTGFSRGAAAARRFVSCINEVKGSGFFFKVCLKTHLSNVSAKVAAIDDIDVPFLGLFDTVSSFGAIKTIKAEFAGDNHAKALSASDNVKELSLNEIYDAQKIIQLCAGDEYRLHFSLTTVRDGGNSKNYIIPGAHSDIGGGYVDKKEEKWEQTKLVKDIQNRTVLYTGYKIHKQLLEEGWFTEAQYKDGKRVVSNVYSFIPYCYMKKAFVENVDKKLFDSGKEKSRGYGENTINKYGLLKKFYSDIMAEKTYFKFEGDHISSYIPKSKKEIEDIKVIRNKYLHLSSNTETGNMAADKNIRIIIKG